MIFDVNKVSKNNKKRLLVHPGGVRGKAPLEKNLAYFSLIMAVRGGGGWNPQSNSSSGRGGGSGRANWQWECVISLAIFLFVCFIKFTLCSVVERSPFL